MWRAAMGSRRALGAGAGAVLALTGAAMAHSAQADAEVGTAGRGGAGRRGAAREASSGGGSISVSGVQADRARL